MKMHLGFAALALLLAPMFVHASCDAVKASIDAKLKAKGLSNYSLDVVSSDQAGQGNGAVVGHCEGDKQILYSRGATAAGDKAAPDKSGGQQASPPASSSSSGA